ncbi:MAG TPA: DUF4395 domain-containing protein [Fibrobacteria bacterium]|nr:DUF4395 domain-containing protein [Fibrobacteria bacterium]
MLCPLAGYKIDENGARVVAGFVVLATVSAWIASQPVAGLILLFLATDFGVRAFSRPRWSPLGRLASWFLRRVGVAPRWVDAGPKRFAARIGLGFAVALLGLSVFGAQGVYVAVSVVLGFCALLESALGFCVGCWFYTGWYTLVRSVSVRLAAGSRGGV